MRNLFSIIFLFLSIVCYSQEYDYRTSIDFADVGGFQFRAQINELIKLAIDKDINKFEIDFTEYYEDIDNTVVGNDSLKKIPYCNKVLFSLSADSTFKVSIEQIDDSDGWITAFGDHYKYYNGVYELLGTFNTSLSKPINDYQKYSAPNIKRLITYKKDTTIIEYYKHDTIEVWHGQFNANFHSSTEFDSTLISSFYFSSKNKLLKHLYHSGSHEIKSSTYKYFRNNQLTITGKYNNSNNYNIVKITESVKRLSKKRYTKKETETTTYYNLNNETGVVNVRKFPGKNATFLYELNDQKLPLRIEIIETNYDPKEIMTPTKGSYMKIKYK